MDGSLIFLMVLSLVLGAACWIWFLWGVKRGEFDDIERPKHRMLDDDDENDENGGRGSGT
ncbi:cbb3-type cytochrome oxidase assembly protein CcoS [Geomesophilobacter sediminis]|uniref:Cbb3-type cytochrome oxidase assembly protein CcoS n=1 Tax=Geomesophilobacter sediminis TaxID=2798584 RepID=A0A8J7JAV1_9BACT|nr:cbb3-type cytochrome oxidase assembly protein CcoS [Geomesophilobacter sediminis]MBJ6724116.1 cbb3-type cytochrome oxidase assembly protein CcoS [Geomesophilobacter sediminis]